MNTESNSKLAIPRLAKRILTDGFLRTWQSAVSVIDDWIFDLRYGLDTRTEVAVKDLDICQEDKRHAEKYKPTRARYFRSFMKHVAVPTNGEFVDVGCGKGRVMMLAAEQGFDRVVGLDISENLCEIAENNIERFRARYRTAAPMTVVCGNMLHYSLHHEETVFFLYSPFERDLTQQFLNKVRESLRQNPRSLLLVINEFRFPELLEDDELFRHKLTYEYGAAIFHVYESAFV